ncbi:MAG: tetratricopeptide repeat protein, partial [Myxococcota bacterium]
LPKEGTERNRRPLAKVTTADLRALRLYTAAKQADEKDDLKNAIALFKEAIELDPDFAMARAKLGTVLYFGTESRLEGLQQWRRALSLGGRLPLREKLYIEASLAWHGEPSTMHRKWVVYSTQFSKQLSGHANLGLVNQWYQGDFVNALRSFRRLLELDPNVGRHYHDVGYVLMEAEETKEALESFNKGVKIDGRPRYGGAADAMIVLGWHEEALRYMDRTKSVPNADDIDYDLEFHLKRVLVAADRERPRSAFESAAAALEKARQSGEHKLLARAQMARATLHWMEKDSASALRFLKDAMSSLMTDLQREDLALMAQPVAHLALIGKLMLRCGAREEAKIIYTKLQHFT